MGRPPDASLRLFVVVFSSLCLTSGLACQSNGPQVARELIQHQAMVDFSGLRSVEHQPETKVTAAPPRQWAAVKLQKSVLYAHQQWKSPSGHTGMGVAYLHLPLPVNEDMVLWFAKRQYGDDRKDGRLIAQWIDEIGRHWFEAENGKYHVRGYVLCRGFSAWVVYFGHKLAFPPDPAEISLAARGVESVVPVADGKPPEAKSEVAASPPEP